ncbi:MAG TPA: RAMP superfamily CRISPR-associated protein [Magnetospirillum sp.]|nr:RAMP superfamily CRISPR-associated protein [Magnetospirillum sp.]
MAPSASTPPWGCAMFERRLKITGTLEVLSPPHVGTGERESRELKPGQIVEVATVVRDHGKNPCLPGPTVKGILRRLAEQALGEDKSLPAFGTSNDDSGTMGRMFAYAALARGDFPDEDAASKHLAYYQGNGIFIEARTRIDRATGTADDGKLFHAEMVAPGIRFTLHLSVLRPTEEILLPLQAALGALQAPTGVAFGKGQTAGNGRLRLSELSAEMFELSADGEMVGSPFPLMSLVPEQGKVTVLSLYCRGPYLALDSSKTAERRKPTDDEDPHGKEKSKTAEPQLQALVNAHDHPVLRGSALLGVLRSRAAWLEAREQQTSMKLVDDPDKVHVPGGPLTAIERLFGVAGWRGALMVRRITVEDGFKPVSLTSVALDRFSMAPIDNALFTTRAFANCRFRVELELDGREGDAAGLFDKLLADICSKNNSLMLGHGGAKGFGWFDVKEAEHA